MATMGRNNWLLLDDEGVPPGSAIAFRWGKVCEQTYRLGETVFWQDGGRPAAAAGEHLVPGLAWGMLADATGSSFRPLYYLIRIIDDLIVSIEPADEERFSRAEAALAAHGIRQ